MESDGFKRVDDDVENSRASRPRQRKFGERPKFLAELLETVPEGKGVKVSATQTSDRGAVSALNYILSDSGSARL